MGRFHIDHLRCVIVGQVYRKLVEHTTAQLSYGVLALILVAVFTSGINFTWVINNTAATTYYIDFSLSAAVTGTDQTSWATCTRIA